MFQQAANFPPLSFSSFYPLCPLYGFWNKKLKKKIDNSSLSLVDSEKVTGVERDGIEQLSEKKMGDNRVGALNR